MELKFIDKDAEKSYKVTKIKMKQNERFQKSDVLFQVENGKVNMHIKAEQSGVITKILIKEGDSIKSGTIYAKADCEEETVVEKKRGMADSPLIGKKEEICCDIAIIGAGPGGYEAAIYAAKNGKKVVLIEKDKVGGTCLNVGCIPTKSIVNSAEKYHMLKNIAKVGVTCEKPSYSREEIIAHKNQVVESLQGGIKALLEANQVRYIKGTASFETDKEIKVLKGFNQYSIKAEAVIIATGSKIAPLPIKGMEEKEVWNSTTALDWNEDFESITIIGGGVIGMEFASLYASFGKKVTVVEYADRILPMVDCDLSETLLEELGESVTTYVNAKVKEIKFSEEQQSIIVFEQEGKEKYVVSDKVLVAVGRKANTEELHLERTKIQVEERTNTIIIDDKMCTNVSGIYAIGDVTGKIQLAHVASHQGLVAVDHILGKEHKMSYEFVPSVIFSRMEIATIGKSEEQLKKEDVDYKVSKFPYAANGKALSMEETKGFVKLIYNKQTKEIEGAAIIGADASNLISSLSIALSNHLSYEDLIHTVFPHPTLGEMIHEASLGLSIGAIHYCE